jgi:protein-disulfide isomerase
MGKSTLTIGVIGTVVSAAMLALGYFAGSGHLSQSALASAEPAIEVSAEPAEPALPASAPELDIAIRDYLLRNPEILVEVQEKLETKREIAQRETQKTTINQESAKIFNDPRDAVVANAGAKTSLVEFFDYNCGYCKRALDDMNSIMEDDKDVRFVLKGFPILGPDSHAAHVVSEAFKAIAPEKYLDFHRALLGGPGKADEVRAIEVAAGLGVGEAALREKMKDPAIEAAFKETYELAEKLGITGTPSYVLADEVVFGAVGTSALSQKIANARSCGSTIC